MANNMKALDMVKQKSCKLQISSLPLLANRGPSCSIQSQWGRCYLESTDNDVKPANKAISIQKPARFCGSKKEKNFGEILYNFFASVYSDVIASLPATYW